MILKNIKNIAITGLICSALFSCDNGRDSNFIDNPETGWVQFNAESSSNIQLTGLNPNVDNTFAVPVRLEAPLNTSDLNVAYSLQQIEGEDPNQFFDSSNGLTIDANTNGSALVGGVSDIVFNLNMISSLTEPMVFDIILQSTNRSSVQVGFDGAPTTHRVSICPPANDFFLGEYALISDEDNLGIPAFNETVTITQGDTPLSREFIGNIYPQFSGGFAYQFRFTLTADGIVNNSPDVITPLSCPGAIGDDTIGYGPSDVLSALPCTDDEFTINSLELKYVGDDPTDTDDPADLLGSGGCVDSFDDMNAPLTLILTKI